MMIKINTGFGYIKDSNDRIIAKYILKPRDHPFRDGYTVIELNNKEELKNIEIYQNPKDQREIKIRKEMKTILRSQAIDNLKDRGEIE